MVFQVSSENQLWQNTLGRFVKTIDAWLQQMTTVVGVFIMGETVPGGGHMGMLYFLLNFGVNLKLLFKNKVLKNKM